MFAAAVPVSANARAESVLGRRQLYMLPTRYGLLFALVLAVLLLASINYGNGLGYGLTFLLGSIAVVSMLHTHRNLHRLRVAPAACVPVFAGESARFEIALVNDAAAPRYGVCLEYAGESIACVDIAAHGRASVALNLPARRRGWLAGPAFRLSTRFPLGLLYSWSRPLPHTARCLVYPVPGGKLQFRTGATETVRPDRDLRPGSGEDFVGVREYVPGDSLRHVDWKALARTGQFTTKQFGGGYEQSLWLDWDTLEGYDTEARLSILCRWVLDAEQRGLRYGLRLPGTAIAPAHGEGHEHECLKALALYGEPAG